MGNPTTVILILFGVYFLQYTDGNRPYEFGFKIDGEQHRHEKKDENGLIMGEFGFITADGVYHVTVYATDENGNFKILSMKNIRVKPYPSSSGAGVKKGKSSTVTAPRKDSVPESTSEEKIIKKQVASPAKSCSHCRLPTTTTTTTVSPISTFSAKNTNSPSTEHYNPNKNIKNFINQNPISLQNGNDQQKSYISKTQQSNPQTVEVNYPQDEQRNQNSQNGDLILSQKLGHQEPNIEQRIQQSYPQSKINNQSDRQEDVVSNNPVLAINPVDPQYLTTQNRPLSKNQQISVYDVKPNNPSVSNAASADLQPNPNPISRNLQGPINEDYLPNQALPENNESVNGPKNNQQNNLNSNNNNYSEGQFYPQQQNYEQDDNIKKPNQLTISSPPTINSRQALLPHNEGERSSSGNPKGERTPKSFGDFIQQSIGPEEFASTGPNLYRPSIPNAGDLSDKPVLLAAQIQNVDKNTNIYSKNPGEKDGLPEGITKDDINSLLYTFNYTVGFHGHHEKGYSNGAKQGYYYVTGRNGVRTRVDYVADEKGFRPRITQEILDIVSEEVPKPETEKDDKYGLKGYEFKWLYFPLDSKPI